MVNTSARKKPHCRTCGMPMEGHKRARGSPVCPNATEGTPSWEPSSEPLSSPSPPPKPLTRVTPERHRHPIKLPESSSKPIKASEPLKLRAPVVIPENGPWHWRNPNWVESPPPPPRLPSPVASLVPTVLVDEDGNTIRGSKCGSDDDEEGSAVANGEATSSMLMDRLAELSKPVVSIFNTRFEDIPQIQDTARRLGIYSGVVHVPKPNSRLRGAGQKVEGSRADMTVAAAYTRAKKLKKPVGREYSWWLIMGQSKTNVQHLVDVQQRGVPCTIAEEKELTEGPKMITGFQMIILGLIGGLVVLCGLSIM
ncbi:hypothetical protein AX17_002115 [Amanita inopinata Kibby_2008]|nr:hypothetical protein AX17_002115 [Amanita inopinata Kibby_2008]